MSPREASLSITAHKAREDAFYGRLSGFVATLANAPYKKEVKAEKLYRPQLQPVKQPERELTPQDIRERQRSLKEHVERLRKEVER